MNQFLEKMFTVSMFFFCLSIKIVIAAGINLSNMEENIRDQSSSLQLPFTSTANISVPLNSDETQNREPIDSDYVKPVYQNCFMVCHSEISATFWYIANEYFHLGTVVLQAGALGLEQSEEGMASARICQIGAFTCAALYVYAKKQSANSQRQANDLLELRRNQNAQRL